MKTVYTQVWRQVQALFVFFVPISLLLSVPNFNCPSAALAFFLASSPIHQYSVFNFDLMKVNFYLKKLFLTGHKAKLGKIPRQIKIPVILLWNKHKGQILNWLNLNSVDHEYAESHVSLWKVEWFLTATIYIITV